MSTDLSDDPLKATLYEFAIFVGILLMIGIGVMIWVYRKKGSKKSSKISNNKKGFGKLGMALLVLFVLMALASLFMFSFMKKIAQVSDPQIQSRYNHMYDYNNKEWKSGWYKFIFYASFAVFVLILILTRSPLTIL